MIPINNKKSGTPPTPAVWHFWATKGGILKNYLRVPEMFEWDSADTCTGKFPLMLMGAKQFLLLFPLSSGPLPCMASLFNIMKIQLRFSIS